MPQMTTHYQAEHFAEQLSRSCVKGHSKHLGSDMNFLCGGLQFSQGRILTR